MSKKHHQQHQRRKNEEELIIAAPGGKDDANTSFLSPKDVNVHHRHVLSFENLTFLTKLNTCSIRKTKSKTIIRNISGNLESGEMVCVMGPSGAGKTTFLNVLALQATYGSAFGKLQLNGSSLDSQVFKSKCYFVGQFDKNWAYLTVKETCTFAANLFGIQNCNDTVDNVIDDVGLRLVAKSLSASLSGGQQRRLSLAIALLKEPSVLFLDEVTSGLDSASADNVCKVLRRLASEKNIIVICTIHQPSTKIFLECFNRLILLSSGQMAYSGHTNEEAEEYFANLGYPMPKNTNPSEHYLELINSDFAPTSERIDTIIDAWASRTGPNMTQNEDSSGTSADVIDLGGLLHDGNGDGCLEKPKILVVLRRQFLMTRRDVSTAVII